jgi:hypothetical protein
MNTSRWFACAALAFLLALPAAVRGEDPVPEDARKLIEDYDKEAKAIKEKADKEVKEKREKLVEKLKQLQDTYARAAKLDEAVAIREKIKAIKLGASEFKPDPGTVGGLRDKVGQTFVFEVTGRTDGTVWGTGIYTDDSPLATAAVHAGVLKNGQKGLVKVTILKGEASYVGSTANDVTTNPYGEWQGSYRIEAAE